MTVQTTVLQPGTWYAIAAEHDVPQRHVYRTVLGGHELAAWRASDGAIQIWDNRCPHRGVRLSLGEVVGNELRCQYHAWRFGKTGACTFIPAQPDLKVPGTIRATPWPVAQAGRLIWTGIDPQGAPRAPANGAVVRAIAIGRPPAMVEQALAQIEPAGLSLTLQPLDQASTIVRGTVGDGDLVRADRMLLALRRRLERAP